MEWSVVPRAIEIDINVDGRCASLNVLRASPGKVYVSPRSGFSLASIARVYPGAEGPGYVTLDKTGTDNLERLSSLICEGPWEQSRSAVAVAVGPALLRQIELFAEMRALDSLQ